MHEPDPAAPIRERELNHRSDRVESPQQYANWRDYAFSELPDDDGAPHPQHP